MGENPFWVGFPAGEAALGASLDQLTGFWLDAGPQNNVNLFCNAAWKHRVYGERFTGELFNPV
jgi:hypothetical protein